MEATLPYAARLEIDPPGAMQRLSTLLRIVFVLPIFLILAIVSGGEARRARPTRRTKFPRTHRVPASPVHLRQFLRPRHPPRPP